MWILAILGAIGAALAVTRREQRGPTPLRDELAAAREAGTFLELKETLREEGEAIIATHRGAEWVEPETMSMMPPEVLPVEPVTGGPVLLYPDVVPDYHILPYPYPVINGNLDVVTSADKASVRRMAARGEMLDMVYRSGSAWV